MLSFASNPHISLSSREFRAFTVMITDKLSQQLTGSQTYSENDSLWLDNSHKDHDTSWFHTVVGHQRLFWMLTGEQKEPDLWHF